MSDSNGFLSECPRPNAASSRTAASVESANMERVMVDSAGVVTSCHLSSFFRSTNSSRRARGPLHVTSCHMLESIAQPQLRRNQSVQVDLHAASGTGCVTCLRSD